MILNTSSRWLQCGLSIQIIRCIKSWTAKLFQLDLTLRHGIILYSPWLLTYSIVIAPKPSPKKGFVKREALAQITLSPNNSTYCHFLLSLNNAFSSMLSKKIGMSIEHLLLSMTFSQTKSRSCKLKTRLLQALGL